MEEEIETIKMRLRTAEDSSRQSGPQEEEIDIAPNESHVSLNF